VAVFLGTTARRNIHAAAAPFAVGLAMAVLLQFGQAIGNAPFNPARATASALFSNSWSLGQLWLFWVAPLVGAAIAGLVFRGFSDATGGTPATGTAAGAPGPDEDLAQDFDDVADSDDAADSGDAADSDKGVARRAEAAGGTAGSEKPATDKPVSGPAPAGDDVRDFFDGPGHK
jgi:aquaporin Z